MENKQEELNLQELETVNGGHIVPVKPDDGNDENSNNSGGATGGW